MTRRICAPGALGRFGVLIASLLVIGACGRAPVASGGTVRVLGSWADTERDAFLEVAEKFEARTGIDVVYSSTRDLRGVIGQALERGSPPDIAGLEGPAHMRELARIGALRPLSGAIDVQAYKAAVAPTFIELGTVDGRLVGAFVKSTLKGLLWYNPASLRTGTPHSFDELVGMARVVTKGPMKTWCVGLESAESSGWPGTDWIESFLLRDAGLETYDAWVRGDLAWSSGSVRRAFESFGQIVAPDTVRGGIEGALSTNFAQAGDPLFASPPGCLLMMQGSFMPAFFEADGHRAGVDYDFFPFPEIEPDAAGAVVGGGDLIGLLTDRPQAAALMDYLIGAEAQQLWVSYSGALSVNRGVLDYPNPIVGRAADLLSGAAHFRFDGSDLMPRAMNEAFWKAVLDFTSDQSRLGSILADLDAVRLSAYGG
ncbi:MAG TPA: ABC transporter substrate-binding protein [Candidatus Limnocylindrales bacterium]|nr:ABC transporter substrate-binding protein [Candidatus Limnocylindrales bacterium]